jgi:hypothetical protein
MKTKLIILIFLTISALGIAATMTIDIPQADVARVAKSFGILSGLGRDATVTEVTEITRRWIISQTKAGERQGYEVSYVEQPLVMQPTPTPTPTASPTATP